jgi:hypothetical protein
MKKFLFLVVMLFVLSGCKLGQVDLPRLSVPVTTSAEDYQTKLGCTSAIAYCGTVDFILNTSNGTQVSRIASFITDTDTGFRWMLFPDSSGGFYQWRMEGVVDATVNPPVIHGLVLDHADIAFWTQQVTTITYTLADWTNGVNMICSNWVMSWVPDVAPFTGVRITADCHR